jgi:4-hydroxybenzoate polyprenyltransferase
MSSYPQSDLLPFELEPSNPGTGTGSRRVLDLLREDVMPLVHLGRPHIAAIAALGTLTFGRMLSGRMLIGLAVIAGLDWFVVNFVNRAVDLEEDRLNAIPGVGYLAAHRRFVAGGSIAVLALSLVMTHLAAPMLTPFRLGYHLLGASYNFKLVGRRLKHVYGVKNVASAAGFLLTGFAYPLAFAGATLDVKAIAALALFFFLFELSYELVYDLRDLDGDRAAGIPTLPAVHGATWVVRAVDLLAVCSIAILAGSFASGRLSWGHAVLAVAPALQMVLLRIWRSRGGPTGADCVRLTWAGASLLAVYQLWLLMGLPGSAGV